MIVGEAERSVIAGWAHILGDDDCWQYKLKDWVGRGYGKVYLNKKRMRANRAVYLLVHKQLPSELHILHQCDNPACCNPKHLFAGTRQENMQDMVRKGRNGKPGSHKRLSPRQIQEILLWPNETQKSLAELYGVSVRSIHRVRNRKEV